MQVFYSADNGLGRARLGLVVSKKTARRANRRNYMKRLLRDCFRHGLPPQDFIVRVRTAFTREQAAQVQDELLRLLAG